MAVATAVTPLTAIAALAAAAPGSATAGDTFFKMSTADSKRRTIPSTTGCKEGSAYFAANGFS